MTDSTFYTEIKEWIGNNIDRDSDYILDNICESLQRDERFDWVGFYLLQGEHLVLRNFRGEETEHTRIKLGDGLCSLAILKDAVINEKDVKLNTEYLACFPSTRSEIIVPIRWESKPVAELDVDSDIPNAFGREDERELQEIGDLISGVVHSLL